MRYALYMGSNPDTGWRRTHSAEVCNSHTVKPLSMFAHSILPSNKYLKHKDVVSRLFD